MKASELKKVAETINNQSIDAETKLAMLLNIIELLEPEIVTIEKPVSVPSPQYPITPVYPAIPMYPSYGTGEPILCPPSTTCSSDLRVISG